jgi:hypothetical protein
MPIDKDTANAIANAKRHQENDPSIPKDSPGWKELHIPQAEIFRRMNEADEAVRRHMDNAPAGPAPDMINSPPHYNAVGIEAIDAIEAALEDTFPGYLHGNAMKYLYRCRYKGHQVEDLMKARWYINRLIDHLKEKDKSNTAPE